jgi:hypothetical protein
MSIKVSTNYEVITRAHGKFLVDDATSVKQHGEFTYFKRDNDPIFAVATGELVVVRPVLR